MKRVISVYLPNWPTDRRRRKLGAGAPPADQPLVLVGRDGRRRTVLAADRAALALGLRTGTPVTKAQALVPGLIVQDADASGDLAALNELARWALARYSPIVAADHPDGLVIDATGAGHLHGGDEAMLADLVGRLNAAGYAAAAAMAGSWGAAHAAARWLGQSTIVIPPGDDRDLLRPLPITALRLAGDARASLHRLGFETVGDLADIAPASLTLRFGPEVARRIGQAFGTAAELILPVDMPDMPQVRRNFAEPIAAAETIDRYQRKLVAGLCQQLERQSLGARRLDLLLHRTDGTQQALRVGTGEPVRDARRLSRLLTERIETIDPGFGIEAMVLSATVTQPLGARQHMSALVAEPEADVGELLDALANKIGQHRLYRMEPVASDVPERSVLRVAPLAARVQRPWPAGWPRPPRLVDPPERIETVALLPDHPPASFTWRGVRRRVVRGDGPERIFGEWWKADAELAAVRDYYRVEDDAGERFWLFRAGDGEDPATGSQRWFMHGIFG